MKKEIQKSKIEYIICGNGIEALGFVYQTIKGRIITINNNIDVNETIEIRNALTGEVEKEVEMISVIEDVLNMDSWVDFTKQAPPIEEEVDLKFIQDGEEKIVEDKLIPMMNGTYIWAYGNYSGCEVIAWKRKISH